MLIVAVFALVTTALADAGGIPGWPDQPGAHRPWFPPGKITGEQLMVNWNAPETFSANEPFFIAHGWAWVMHDYFNVTNTKGDLSYSLEMDGELLEQDHLNIHMIPAVQDDPAYGDHLRQTMWIYNFPDGLEGTHQFVGKYWVTCQALVDNGILPGPCDDPKEYFLWDMYIVSINFE